MRLEEQKGQQGPRVDSRSGISTKLLTVGLVASGDIAQEAVTLHFFLVWLDNTEWSEITPYFVHYQNECSYFKPSMKLRFEPLLAGVCSFFSPTSP